MRRLPGGRNEAGHACLYLRKNELAATHVTLVCYAPKGSSAVSSLSLSSGIVNRP
jgi:hypothetical protein